MVGKHLSAKEQRHAPPGTTFHQFVVPPIAAARSDCAYTELPAFRLPKAARGLRSCEMTMPRGCVLIDNGISIAPGFTMGNVHVMAGVPRIMQAMFEILAPSLTGGMPVKSRTVWAAGLQEGAIAAGLEAIQHRYPDLDVGSYPFYRSTGNGVALVAKGINEADVIAAGAEITAFISQMGHTPIQGEPE